jgi:hypothetical protein
MTVSELVIIDVMFSKVQFIISSNSIAGTQLNKVTVIKLPKLLSVILM